MRATEAIPPLHCVITGANGFIGASLIPALSSKGYATTGWSRANGLFRVDGDNHSITHWQRQLRDIDVVVHLAGIAHKLGADSKNIEHQYDLINTQATLRLFEAAIKAGVKRFVFISTTKVFGEGNAETYTPNSEPTPCDAYARSKLNAEHALMEIAKQNAIELVIIRPPLVYGRNTKANFALLQKLAALPLPLPFASIDNRRDLIAIDNLIDLIDICLTHPKAPGRIWLCADAHPYSLADMIAALRAAKSQRPGLFHFPTRILKSIISIIIGSERTEKIFSDFTVDDGETHQLLGWLPHVSMHEVIGEKKSRRQQ